MQVEVPYFDNSCVDLSEDTSPDDPAIAAFLQLGRENRLADSRHVYAYFQDFYAGVGVDDQDWLDAEMGILSSPDEIWGFVSPGAIFVESDRDDAAIRFVVMEAECVWEEEHGLMLVWREGKQLSKVSGFDGHLTNADAFADENLAQTVYVAVLEEYTTRLEG